MAEPAPETTLAPERGPECGVVYVATGAGYAGLAVRSAASVGAVCPGLPRDLFTDAETAAALPPEARAVFERIEVLDQVWARSKIDGMARSRFARSLFLDADTRAISDFRDVFDLLERFDLALAHDQSRNAEECHVVWRRELPAAFPQFNTGVIAYRSNPEVLAFFERWAEAVRDHGIGRDQPALRELAWDTDLRLAALPDGYNLMNWAAIKGWTEVQAAPRILHSARFHRHFSAKGPKPREIATVPALVGPAVQDRIEALIEGDRTLARAAGRAPRARGRAEAARRRARVLAQGVLRKGSALIDRLKGRPA